ncbi:HD-domain/PDEase-like protein [Plenodomus tracheiphilus IPT5]|uniref:Phosphodiesterase n=1 Tax=Plenodomus tracheiphilus IPT5 TaxID=1408161 RepID=A0A6A7BMA0_9PLEO|nr:HD-domain/PDEase-like protein [Plenodomus tracheiphilus IPT5]
MDNGACNVIYIDRRANDEHVRKETLSKSLVARTSTGNVGQSYFTMGKASPREVHDNVEAILTMFNEVYVCGSGKSCLANIASILDSSKANVPTFVIIDIPYDEEQRAKRLSREPRTPSPTSSRIIRIDTTEPDDIYAMHLLTHISSEITSRNFSKLVVPVVMLTGLSQDASSGGSLPSPGLPSSSVLTDSMRLSRYLDAGAVDVLSSPLSKDRMHSLVIHGYRLQKEFAREEASFLTTKRNRKLSWVGVDDTKPYAYLREAMVSNLMTGICNPETVGDSLEPSDFELDQDRMAVVEDRVGTWAFSAHELTDDELLYAALVMLKHALQMPELEKWTIAEEELIVFLLASRTAYNEFVKYHNFRHVVDVLQALFHFLVRIGTLPPYPSNSDSISTPKSPIAQLLKPFDALTLLISAIGHDVGHPGVNNAFLVALNAPLAQLYNDRSVLESFHCAAYSQILRRYWPKAFADISLRKLMINNILATDMGLHFKYMSDLGSLQEKVAHNKGIDAWSVKVREEQKDLTCGLLIKCADICNVARKFETAAKWANILTDEFSNQGMMEEELQMTSCLFGGPPVSDDIIKLGESQVGFMNIFARPLFEAMTDILPAMRFAVDEILTNKAIWEKKIDDERHRKRKTPNFTLGLLTPGFAADPTPSPRSGSPARGTVSMPAIPVVPTVSKVTSPEDAGRRGSTGSITGAPASRRSSLGVDRGSQRSSATGGYGQRTVSSRENHNSSRRGSGDPSLTAILVTQTPNSSEPHPKGSCPSLEDHAKGDRKDTLTSGSSKRKDKDAVRPVTAPSRRSQVVSLYPLPQPSSQSHSQVDLSHTANGNLDGSKLPQWDDSKLSAESNLARSDGTRDSSWWRQMSTRRRARDVRHGEADGRGQLKEPTLDTSPSNTDSNVTAISPGKRTTSGKIKSFFKRKPSGQKEQQKQLSSYGSSSQLRTPPTSDPGQSLSSDR